MGLCLSWALSPSPTSPPLPGVGEGRPDLMFLGIWEARQLPLFIWCQSTGLVY